MALEQVFSLTPRESYLYSGSGHLAYLTVHGVSNDPNVSSAYRTSFDHQHSWDELFFHSNRAGDAAADYTLWSERNHSSYVQLNYDLSTFEPHKEVALTFGFDAVAESRVLIYSDDGLLDEEVLHVGDNQFLIEVESTSSLYLNFIHVNVDGSSFGGSWFLRGIDGYIA
jgi:hypothetical protein